MHGFNKTSKDMWTLENNLKQFGYECFSPDFELTYKEIEHSTAVLEEILEEMDTFHLKTDEKVHLIGHSTGGLVIRKLIANSKYVHKIGRCVLIASPNKGSRLANIAGNIKPYVEIYKTLKSLRYESVAKLNHNDETDIEMAAIAGNHNNLLLGKLIGGVNDGRVEVESVYLPHLKDFMILPYGHKDIHHQPETARWVDAFLRTGKFQ
nr:alpha/beta hydrolase [Heyndrickxia ginsengihumi]